jgi:hypothetical protein
MLIFYSLNFLIVLDIRSFRNPIANHHYFISIFNGIFVYLLIKNIYTYFNKVYNVIQSLFIVYRFYTYNLLLSAF